MPAFSLSPSSCWGELIVRIWRKQRNLWGVKSKHKFWSIPGSVYIIPKEVDVVSIGQSTSSVRSLSSLGAPREPPCRALPVDGSCLTLGSACPMLRDYSLPPVSRVCGGEGSRAEAPLCPCSRREATVTTSGKCIPCACLCSCVKKEFILNIV